MRKFTRTALATLLAGGYLAASFGFSVAQAASSATEEIRALNATIDQKKSSVDLIRQKIGAYQSKIDAKQNERATLSGELDLLSNRIAKTELDIQATNEEMDGVSAEISLLDKQIIDLEQTLETDRASLRKILQEIQVKDGSLTLELLFGSDSFSDLFDEVQSLEQVNEDLHTTLSRASSSKEGLVTAKTASVAKQGHLEDLQAALVRSKELLEEESGAKEQIIQETNADEAQFRSLLYELKQEQAYIDSQIAKLQGKVEGKIAEIDNAGGDSAVTGFSWPVPSQYTRISAIFHDPDYPYKNLFPHTGIDIPVPTGTTLKAAAPGYVAWAKTGPSYGNYIMIIHANGLATLYAHLSAMNVQADQFVARGETIGRTGSTGLSTGPHLHFEVRKNGIPVNPLDYLIDR